MGSSQMDDRTATCTMRDSDGDIRSLWGCLGSTHKAAAVIESDLRTHRYPTQGPDGTAVEVEVEDGTNGEYSHSSPNGSTEDGLDNVPDC